MAVTDLMSLLMLSRSDFDMEGEVGELSGKIAYDSLYVLVLESVFLEEVIVRNIYWLGLLCDLYIIDL